MKALAGTQGAMERVHTLKVGKVRSRGSLAVHPQPSPGPMASGGQPPGPVAEHGSSVQAGHNGFGQPSQGLAGLVW